MFFTLGIFHILQGQNLYDEKLRRVYVQFTGLNLFGSKRILVLYLLELAIKVKS